MKKNLVLVTILSFSLLIGCRGEYPPDNTDKDKVTFPESIADIPFTAETPSTVNTEQTATSQPNNTLYKKELGPYATNSRGDLVLHDAARGKKLQCRVTWPETEGAFPIIVWSHGMGGTKDINKPLIEYWASHGYVCIQMNHSDSRQLTKTPDSSDWFNRPLDIQLVLDNLETLGQTVGILDTMDKSNVGMGGHSFGAYTTQLVGGTVTNRLNGEQQSHADPRPKAFLMISPQGTGRLLSEDSFRYFNRPAMMITGSEDNSPFRPNAEKSYKWRLEAWQNLPPGDKFLLFIDGADHSFGGISGISWIGSGPEDEHHVNYVRTSALAFWDSYLRQDDTAAAYLKSPVISIVSQNEARIDSK